MGDEQSSGTVARFGECVTRRLPRASEWGVGSRAMSTCGKCHRRGTNAWYTFHYGVPVGTTSWQGSEVHWYRDIRQDGAFICSACGARHVMVRYWLPFAVVPVLLLVTAYAPITADAAVGAVTVTVITLALAISPAAWWSVVHAVLMQGISARALGPALAWLIGTYGTPAVVIFAIAQGAGSSSGWLDWVVRLTVLAQSVLLWLLWREREVLLETLAWRLNARRLCGMPAWRSTIRGWNSAQFSNLRSAPRQDG